ncbi:restriction endonuclease subunit S [uncultured Clostridium sp.]|uniref:restriction endonuclease subunit S n=1 Tax=uncultured Clostridium sp. TaxID=59620 RepID=UPI002670DF73|nr:restriction endonuclease subunit S [uncultured Clostridium sp.]
MKKVRDKYKMTELGEIPSEWHIEVLGECSNVTKLAGFEFTEYIEYIDDGEIIALRALNLKNGKLNLEDIKKIDKKVSESLTRSKLYINDVLFSYVGTVGEVALIEENDKFHLAPNVAKLTFNDSVVPKFALQYLMSSNMRNEINRYVTTTSQPALSMENIRKLKIIVPKKEEQEKISFILSTVDEQIDNVDALIEKNKELKKGLMQTLFTKGIGHTKFKNTEIGEIPEEWDVKKLECVFEILDSMRKPIKASDREKIEGNIPYYGASGVIDWINDYIFDEELILLGEDGENLNSRNSDLAFKISGKTWVNNHAHVFRVINKKECNIDFMVYYLEAKDYSIYIAGSAQPKITQAQCRKFLLPLPEKQEQDKIASILLESDKKIEEYENKKQKLEELKKGLMQQLLTGMIRVTV